MADKMLNKQGNSLFDLVEQMKNKKFEEEIEEEDSED
jgi:hypothetical protein